MYVCVSCSVVSNSLQPHQAPLAMEFSRQEYWSGLLGSPPGDLLNPGIETKGRIWPTLQADSLLSEPPGKPQKQLCSSLNTFYYFRVTILHHCIGFYNFELLSYTQIHWPLQYCCKVGVRSRTWFYPITNSCVNLLPLTGAGSKQQALGSESKECITYGTSVMNIRIFVLLSFCS